MKSLSHIRPPATPWTAAHQASPSMGFSRQSTGVGCHCPLRYLLQYIAFSGTITSWQIDGETMETVTHFIFLGSNITADGDCSHEIKRCSLEGKL